MRRRQTGIVLIAMLAVIMMSAAWFTVRSVAALPGDYTARNRAQNAAVLARAKAALMGHVALQAAKAGETDPGRFACPEAPGNIGGTSEGAAATYCSLPAIGRFPWRTIGTDKFLDAAGEPLWYVVASGWSYPNSAAVGKLGINSNCTFQDVTALYPCNAGLLTVDATKDTVALIIAPGPAINEFASTGCTARVQARAAPSPAIDPLDYLECYNTATSSFVTKGVSTSFNDQVVKITVAEIVPVIEAAIADRFAKEIAPLIKAAYSNSAGGTPWATSTVLPFAATFASPTFVPLAGNATNYRGQAGQLQGLPPLTYSFTASPGSASACTPAPCTPTPCVSGSDARCDPSFVAWRASGACGAANCTAISNVSGVAPSTTPTCTVSGTPTTLSCTLTYNSTGALAANSTTSFTLGAVAGNAGMSLRQINSTVPFTGVDTLLNAPYGYTVRGSGAVPPGGELKSDGSATISVDTRIIWPVATSSTPDILCGLVSLLFGLPCYQYTKTFTVPMALLSDHEFVDPGNSNPAIGFTDHTWYFRNKWHELSYYALASGVAASGARSCTTGGTCLQVAQYFPSASAGKQRSILLLGGAKIGTQARPPLVTSDLLEGTNADGDTSFAVNGVSATLFKNKTFNDHIVVIDTN